MMFDLHDCPDSQRVRVGHLLTLLDIASPTLYRRMHKGEVPAPDGHDSTGHPYWHAQTVRAMIDSKGSSK